MNENTLDLNPVEFRKLLNRSSDLVIEQFEQIAEQKGYCAYSQQQVESWFNEPIPESGMEMEALLSYANEKVLQTATGNLGPHMYAYVMAGGTQVSIVAEKLAATINQHLGKWHLGPAMNEIEKRVVQWGADMIGYAHNAGGVMVSGGSAANLAGLTVARNVFFERLGVRKKGMFGIKPFAVYASNEVHGCVDKSLEILGIGTDQLRKIPTLADFSIDIGALKQAIETDLDAGIQPFCVIGSAGTVNTGAIDDLNALADVADQYSMWFHVDGAYGGLAACLPELKAQYTGIEKADSVAIDFHKWLYQTFEAGCVLVKDWSTLKRAYYKEADYLDTQAEEEDGRLDFNKHYFQLSRNAKAFKVWMSIKAYGFAALRHMIQKDIDLARYLADQVEAAADFELSARSDLAIACFRYVGELTHEDDIRELNQKLIPALEKDGRVFITGTKLNGQFVIRACLINHRKNEATTNYLLQVIREVATTILKPMESRIHE